MQAGYATVCHAVNRYDAERYLLAAIAHYVIPAVLAGTAFALVAFMLRRFRGQG